jgi:hypothetical protein
MVSGIIVSLEAVSLSKALSKIIITRQLLDYFEKNLHSEDDTCWVNDVDILTCFAF